ncbi:S8 family serine peptidase [Phaeodactylibacter sp.]|uniref:S8 family serine peptidase n=1 Tax=Phaeodactylibacter sp. TaxID=1940289 RepID=UPI0025D95073|nr:S8 family serine peptidase [Phaeodactylibacter sp.]MCI4648515.1 S8 family serine peptidase [Phaeodactylibacter sp.]MCI5090951.1 S8 family serine peptidase [Phaeodactylibacter sp.]
MKNNIVFGMLAVLFLPCLAQGQAEEPRLSNRFEKAYEEVQKATNHERLQQIIQEQRQENARLQIILDSLERAGVKTRGEGWQVTDIDEAGKLIYTANNSNLIAGATTSTDQLWGGSYNLNGDGMFAGIWEAGEVPLVSHQELEGRIILKNSTSADDHATHVAGTMIGAGVEPSARGMANQALLHAYTSLFDNSEMASAASNDNLLISNHSYGQITGWYYGEFVASLGTGYYWFGDFNDTEDDRFGRYTSRPLGWDQVAYNAPYYLIVKSAGNDRNDTGPSSGEYFVRNNLGSWVSSSAFREDDGGADGYDCIPEGGVAKNILTVGAINDLPGGYTNSMDVSMSSFSSWGGADDGRIKPDIVGNGVGLYSSTAASDTDYSSFNGTSMSAPNVSGSLLLLQELHARETGSFMRSATLKALAIHTADEAGPAPGPDMAYGWGVLNARKAADFILSSLDNDGATTIEETLNTNGTFSQNIDSEGGPIRVTLVWTDPPGPSCSSSGCPQALVNDLELRIVHNGTTYFPYTIPQPGAPAQTNQPNNVDNVEQVYLPATNSGSYQVQVFHSGQLQGGNQDFSLLISGGSGSGSASNQVFIQSRQLNGQLKDSGHDYGYADFTNEVPVSLDPGQNVNLTLAANGDGAFLPVYWYVWIDLNQNQVFESPGELMLSSGPVQDAVYNGSISIPTTAISGDTRMRITVSQESDTGPCAVHSGETEDYTVLIGAPASITLSPGQLSFLPAGGSLAVALSTNCNDWSFSNVPSWLQVQPASGSGDASITVMATANVHPNPRTASVTVSGCGISTTLNVTQNGQNGGSGISFTPPNITLDWAQGSTAQGNVVVGSSAFWTAQPSDSWIEPSQYAGTGPLALTISAASDNSTGQNRFGTITLMSGGNSFVINVEQLPEPTTGTMPPWGEPTPTNQAGTFIAQVQVEGLPANAADWVAAFDQDGNVAGSSQVILSQGIAYINMVIYADDVQTPEDEGVGAGEAFTLHLWDASEDEVLDYPFTGAATLFTEWVNTNGAPMPAYSNPDAIYNFERSFIDIIPLRAGWNLVSTDVVPTDSSVVSLFSGLLPGNLEYVTGFDQDAIFYDPSLAQFSTLTHWTRGFGYWVRVTQEDTLRIPGQLIPDTYFKPMQDGWNLVAYLPQDTRAPQDYLNGFITEGQLIIATGFDGNYIYYDPEANPIFNGLQEMRNSLGYWLRLQNTGSLQSVDIRGAGQRPNLNYSFLWGTTNAPAGSVIEVLNEKQQQVGVLRVQEDGLIKPKPFYGEDLSIDSGDGIPEGEHLYFRFGQQMADTVHIFYSDRLPHRLSFQFSSFPSQRALTASPVPFSEILNLKYALSDGGEALILIRDALGRTIHQQQLLHASGGTYQTTWACASAAEGLYTISLIHNGARIESLPVILQR